MIKKIFCLFSLLLLTGCSVNYSIIYEKNGSIKDNLTIEEGVAIFDNSKPDDWNDLFNSRIHDIKIMNEYNNEKNYYVINLNNTYLDINKYFEDEFFKKYVGYSSYECDEECTIKVVFNEKFNEMVYGNISEDNYTSSFIINMSFPYRITESNADNIENKIVTWNLSRANQLSNLYIKYNNPVKKNELSNYLFNILIALSLIIIIIIMFKVIKKVKKSNEL